MTSSGNEPATIRLVAHCLNHLSHRMHRNEKKLECFQFARNLKYLLSTAASSSFRRHAINLTETKMDSLPHVWRSVTKKPTLHLFQFLTLTLNNNNGSNLTLHLSNYIQKTFPSTSENSVILCAIFSILVIKNSCRVYPTMCYYYFRLEMLPKFLVAKIP